MGTRSDRPPSVEGIFRALQAVFESPSPRSFGLLFEVRIGTSDVFVILPGNFIEPGLWEVNPRSALGFRFRSRQKRTAVDTIHPCPLRSFSMRTPAKAQRTAAHPATPRWLTISMVATILAVSEDTVYTMIREGRLPAVRIRDVRGAALRINEADLGRLLSESYVTYPNWDGAEIRGRR